MHVNTGSQIFGDTFRRTKLLGISLDFKQVSFKWIIISKACSSAAEIKCEVKSPQIMKDSLLSLEEE
jgi:hypothetical protein